MYRDNSIQNYDCRKFLDGFDNSSIDLIIADGPYNLNKAEWDKFSSHEEFMEFNKEWMFKAYTKLKASGSIYIFNTPKNSAYIMISAMEMGFILQNWLTWDKRDGMSGAKRKYNNGQETILFMTKSNDHVFNHNDIRTSYDSTDRMAHAQKKGIIKNGKRWFPNPNGKLCGEVWHYPSERHQNKKNGKTPKMPHITPKPKAMIERIIKASSNENDLVVDPFLGIGTTAIVAKQNNRKYICNDANKEYTDLCKKTLRGIK